MPDQPSAASGVLRRPFTEQVAFFRGKLGNLVPTERWDDLEREQHDTGFMVAGAAKADLLSDLAAAVDRTIAEGKGLESFRKDFRAIVERHGWHGWTGEDTKGGRAWRTRTIYRANASTSYSAGRYAQLVAGDFPLWVYRHGGSKEPRLEHLGFDGLYLPPSHDFWTIFYPPSDWGCSCYVLGARSERGARRLGGDPDKTLPEGWDRIDPRTGAPHGAGRNWDYAPGASVAPVVRATAEKIRHWDYRIAKGFMEGVPEAMRDSLAASYRSLPSVADDARGYARRVLGDIDGDIEPLRTLGLVGPQQADIIADTWTGDPLRPVDLYDFSMARDDILHIVKGHGDSSEELRGQRAITAEDYALLPLILNQPDRVEQAGRSRAGEPLLSFVKTINGEQFIARFAVRNKQRTLGLKTFFVRKGK
ncbi:PBECR3 domain-containing polyvalent protein [Sphingobium cloacae]|uniref:Virion morphogenesis protein n=1 Tax=Sphingobium cloacae TaxID=120107 RepID=A0A1E1F2M7_9SPHN|nr:phage minor head protein [Sphingobium cloacae]BAV64773.1 virion morphogenesis protein [Sphingobium cloacae]